MDSINVTAFQFRRRIELAQSPSSIATGSTTNGLKSRGNTAHLNKTRNLADVWNVKERTARVDQRSAKNLPRARRIKRNSRVQPDLSHRASQDPSDNDQGDNVGRPEGVREIQQPEVSPPADSEIIQPKAPSMTLVEQVLYLAKAGNTAENIGLYADLKPEQVRKICAEFSVEVL